LPPTPTGRQASLQLPRQEQDAGAVFQLCDRISAFVYGESKPDENDGCPALSRRLSLIDTQPATQHRTDDPAASGEKG